MHECGDLGLRVGHFRFWHETDQSARSNDVCSWVKTGSERRIVKPTRLDP
jgi:hypothetical protein